MPKKEEQEESSLAYDLAELKPVKIVAYLTDGTQRDFKVPKGRDRWDVMESVLSPLSYERLECFGADDAPVGTLESDSPRQPQETLSYGAQLLRAFKECQSMAFREMRDTFKESFAAHNELVQTLVDRLVSLEQRFGESLELAHEAAKKNAPAAPRAEDKPEESMADKLVASIVPIVVGKALEKVDLSGVGQVVVDVAKQYIAAQKIEAPGTASGAEEPDS